MKIIEEIKKFKTHYDYGKIGNEVLYEMCKKYHYHNDKAEIVGKVWLIGRSYAVALERNKNNKKAGDDFYIESIAPKFKNGFDNLLSTVRKLHKLNEENIPIIIKTHKKVTDFIYKEITKDYKRSFASKYLHFHFPELFFIYDSRVVGVINAVVRAVDGTRNEYRKYLKNLRESDFDKEYATFFAKCFYFWEFCKKEGVPLTTRQIDSFLIERANNIIKNKNL